MGESDMRMDDMPIGRVEQVLSFLPLADVYKCRSVCRKWHGAADRVLNNWEKLDIVMKDRDNQPVREDKNVIFMQNDAEEWIKRLKDLVRLKAFRFLMYMYYDSDDSEDLMPVVHAVVQVNASTLTYLNIDSMPLPFDADHPVEFSNLQDLACSLLLNPDQVAACPQLINLIICTAVQTLHKVPAETLTSLCIDDLKLETGSHEEIEQLVAALSRFTLLKHLSLIGGFSYFDYDDGEWTELHDQALSLLFTNMKELEDVFIIFPFDSVVNVDVVIESLVNNSPSVRSIRLTNCEITDASLHSLSRLTGLQKLAIRSKSWESENWQNGITTEGILSLLRGGSRNVLRDLELEVTVLVRPDEDQIRAEGELMQQVTGSLFSFEVVDYNTQLLLLRGGSRNFLRDFKVKVSVSPDFDHIRAEKELVQEETGRTFKVVPGEAFCGNLRICLKAAEAAAELYKE